MKPSLRSSTTLCSVLAAFCALGLLHSDPASAACTTTGITVTCNTNAPNPYTGTVGNGPNTASGASVSLTPNAQISAGNANAISLGDNASINLGANSVVQNNATSGSGTNGNGLWNAGKNTIEFGSFGNLTIGTGAVVQSLGTSNNAEAINVMGIGNIITNYGTITSRNGAAIWFEDRTTGGSNTVDNYGTITTSLGANTNVIGNSQSGNVNFINESGAVVNGSLSFAAGNDTLTLFPNSVITGGFNGGGGTNTLVLNGAAGSSDTLPGNISNFQTLTKTGLGSWTLSGAVGNNGGAALGVEVQNGTLALTGNNSNFNGNILVDIAGTLEARAQSLPPTVTDNGVVRFTQDSPGTYAGVISGTGSVQKTLGGTLTLTGNNSYAGGTTISLGEIVISSDTNLGAASGGLILNGGGLGTATNVTLSRVTTLGPLGGTFDTKAGTLTDNGVVTGSGTLTKIGAGTLALTATNTYTGTTFISQGTLQVSSDANLGDPTSTLDFNGGTLATTASMTTARAALLEAGGGTLQTAAGTTLTDSGVFSGSGMLTKTGAGTLALTAINTQTGGTSINGGVMIVTNDTQLGASSAPLQFNGGTLVAGSGLATRPTIINASGGTVELDGDPLDPAQFLTVSGPVSGSGGFTKTGTGTLIYSGDNSYTGPTTIAGGGFYLNGNSSAQTGTITAESGTRLGGTGTIGGNVVVQDGATLTPGSSPLTAATLTIDANLSLSSNSSLFYNMVQANAAGGSLNDLVNVGGNLTLGGTFNVLDQGQTLGPGVYRIFNYGGTLTNNGLTLGHYISSTGATEGMLTGFSVQTAIPGQINLVNTSGLTLNYWDGDIGPKNDGAVNGGNGTWQVAGPASTSNWTGPDGTINAPWNNGEFAIFAGTAGAVQVSSGQGQVQAAGMQFEANGYTVQGAELELVGSTATPSSSIIRVGDGTASAVSTTATIASVLSGGVLLDKTDLGTLILTAVNTYTGGTEIDGGTLQIANDANLGAAGTGLVFNSGMLATTADIATPRAVTLNASGGAFAPAPSTTLELDGVISGTGGLSKTDAGTLILTGTNTYTGGTLITSGTLQVGDGGIAGSITGDVTDGGTLAFNHTDPVTFTGIISDYNYTDPSGNPAMTAGKLVQTGSGTLILTADNTYTGGTTISAGTLQVGDGSAASGAIAGNVTNNSALVFARPDTITFGGTISGSGSVTQAGPGITVLTANNSYAGPTAVNGGWLYIDGDQSAATGPTTVANGARLGGDGIVGGNVIVQNGGQLSPGAVPLTSATLTINGDLTLNPNSSLLFNMVQANTAGGALNDMLVVHGNLTLGGVFDVVDQGQTFGPGVYRIISYDGSCDGGGTCNAANLTIGSLRQAPATPQDPSPITGSLPPFIVQTAIPGQVNLVLASGLNLNYWDGGDAVAALKDNGRIDGGNGTWWAAGSGSTNNWTEVAGSTNAPWDNSGVFAIFSGVGVGPLTTTAPACYATAGVQGCTVTVDDTQGQVNAAGMQFATSGYTITGGAINLVSNPDAPGTTPFRVGDGSTLSSGIVAKIDSVLMGSTQLVKSDLGTLILTGANTYTGGTLVNSGTLQISSDTNLGAAGTSLELDGGALATTNSITTARPVALGAGGGVFIPSTGTVFEVDSAVVNAGGTPGALTLGGPGTLVLTGANSYSGGTSILPTVSGSTVSSGGTLQVGNGGATGSIQGNVANGGTLAFNRSGTVTYAGVISDYNYTDANGNPAVQVGKLAQNGTGTLILTGDNTITGGTTVASGTLQLGDGGTTGGVTGDIVDNGTVAVNRSDTVIINGLISGTGDFVQAGTGTTIMAATGDGHGNSYSGRTIVQQGTLQIGTGGTTGGLENSTEIIDNGVYIADIHATYSWAGSVSGTGSVIIDQGAGNTLTVLGANTYTGGSTIASGTVQLGDGGTAGTLLGDIANFGTLIVDHSDDLILANVMTGTGNAIKEGANTIVLIGDSTYTGGTTIAGGTLQLGNGGTTGSILGNIIDNAALVFNHSDSLLINSPISGTGSLTQAGTGTVVLGADNTYTGGTTVTAGTLQVGNGDIHGSVMGNIVDNAILSFSRSDTYTFSGTISGTGQLVQVGPGTLILTGSNTYAGGTAIEGGVLQISSDGNLGTGLSALHIGGATLAITADITNTSARQTVLEQLGGTFLVPTGLTLTNSGRVEGAGGFTLTGGGTMILSADNDYAGPTTVAAGTLRINGDQSAATGLTTVAGGGILGGDGIVGGDTVIADGGTLAPGNSPGTITIKGRLTLNPGSILSYDLGQASVVGGPLNDHTIVGGNLMLDGTINIVTPPGGSFDPGIYRIISYAGTLTNNGLDIGAIPSPDFFVQTSVANQVNLVNTAGLTLNYWDGAAGPKNDGTIQGGDGVWRSGADNDHWTNAEGTINAPFTDAAFATFEGAGGTVTVDASLGAINVSGMQFAADGYVVQGDAINLVGPANTSGVTIIRVGDGTAESAAFTATINSALTGDAGLVKTDLGTLILNGINTYGGGTAVNGGVLQISTDANLGAASGALSLDGGTLRTTTDITSTRATTLGVDGGTFETLPGTTFTLNGAVNGAGALTKSGAGVLVLTQTNSYTGGTSVLGGALQIASDTNLGDPAGTLELDGGTLHTTASITSDRFVTFTGAGTITTDGGTTSILNGAISGSGGFTKRGAGTLVLIGNGGGYTGAGQIAAGTLAIDGALGGTLAVQTAGRLEGKGEVGSLTNGGVVAPGHGGIGTLTVAGNYIGNGGSLEIEAALGGDSSPADRLVVTGATSGTTRVTVINQGGLGNPTVNGIKIVSVAGVSNGVFTLKGDYLFEGQPAVVAGAFGYRLYKNGVTDPADGDWYLRSSLLNPPESGGGGNGEGPPSPPLYQPGVPIYEAYPQTLLALNSLPTLQQRVGNRSWSGDPAEADTGGWIRMEGTRYRPKSVVSTSMTDKNIDSWQMQMGLDAALDSGDIHPALVGGVTARYSEADAGISSVFGNGTISTRGYGFGGTLTWYEHKGAYIDGQAQVSWYDSDLKSGTLGRLADNNHGMGESVSLEAGKRTAVGNGLSVTPQAQMIYSSVDFDRFVDPAGAVVSIDSGDSFETRLGLSIDRQDRQDSTSGNTRRTHIYGLVNLLYEWLDGTRTEVSGTGLANRDERLWAELGVGGSYNWGEDRFALYTEISVDTAVRHFGDSYSLKGTGGFRWRF